MRINEVTQPNQPPQVSKEFRSAVDDWQSMWNSAEAAKIILASPEAEPFKRLPTIPGIYIYRAIKPLKSVAKGPVVPYSLTAQGAVNFAASLYVTGTWYLIEKSFYNRDFLLDFTAMIKYYNIVGHQDENEHEVWMRNTPYYSRVTQDYEIQDKFKTYG